MKRLLLLLALAMVLTSAVRAQIVFDDADLWLSHSRVRIRLEDLRNFGDTPSDKLRLVLIATEEWDDDDREVIARVSIPRLDAGQTRERVRKTVRYHRPGWGWYYLTLALQERTFDDFGQTRWVTRDAVEFDDPIYFSPRPWRLLWPF